MASPVYVFVVIIVTLENSYFTR